MQALQSVLKGFVSIRSNLILEIYNIVLLIILTFAIILYLFNHKAKILFNYNILASR